MTRTAACLCVVLTIAAFSCGGKRAEEPKEGNWMTVTITEVAVNDLGQVILFSGERGKMPKIFFKDFYRQGVSPEQMHKEMKDYAERMERHLHRAVAVQYQIDDSGSMKILRTSEP